MPLFYVSVNHIFCVVCVFIERIIALERFLDFAKLIQLKESSTQDVNSS